MTHERDIERVLDTWFVDGPTEVPDRVLDAVVDRIERQSQRPAWRVQDRERRRLNPALRPFLAVAAVIVVAVIGINLLPVMSNGIGGATPMPSPSASPSRSPVAPSPSPGPVSLRDESWDRLDPGTYIHDLTAPAVTFTIPAGWWLTTDFDPGFGVRPEAFRTDEGLRVWYDMRATVQDAACTEAPDPSLGHTADDLIAEFTTREGIVATAPRAISIGGLDGQWIDVQVAPDWTATCPFDPSLGPSVTLFTDADPESGDTTPFWGVSGDERLRLYILDDKAGSTVLIAINAIDASTFEGLLAETLPVLDTFEFGLAP